jgi:Domain of unknown function (DUF222)
MQIPRTVTVRGARQDGLMADGVSLSEVRAVRESLHALVRDFDAEVCDGALAKRFVEEFARLRRLVDAGTTLALARVERTAAWAHDSEGARSTAEWFARKAGLSLGEAIRTSDTAKKVVDLPETEAALRAGSLSAAQAHQIADAAIEDPAAEAELVALAPNVSFRQLRDRARQRKAAAQDEAARAARQRALRCASRYTDDDGMRNYLVKVTPEQAARIEPVWDRFTNAQFANARREGRRESGEAYAADAFVAMIEAALDGTTGAATPASSSHGLVLVDATALRRGHTVAGETCEVAGIGPIDVTAAKRLLGDAVVDILVRDGVDVRTVAHAGRSANRRQKAALLAEWECEVRGCGVQRGLEVDHIEAWAETHRTAIEDLGPKCKWHHHLKTNKGWRDGPRGDDGKRALMAPNDRAGPGP